MFGAEETMAVKIAFRKVIYDNEYDIIRTNY